MSGFVDTFRYFHNDLIKYTYWSVKENARPENKGWRIDYFIASMHALKFITESQIHDEILGSDHCPISVNLDFRKKT